MRIKIFGTDHWIDANDIPIAVELTKGDREAIAAMPMTQAAYCPNPGKLKGKALASFLADEKPAKPKAKPKAKAKTESKAGGSKKK